MCRTFQFARRPRGAGLSGLILLLSFVSPVWGLEERDGEGEWFELRVRPVLAEHCHRCHGERRQKAGLRLDRWADIESGGPRGPLFVPGDPDASLLIQAVRYQDPELQMPPRRRLDEALVEDLVEWVARGAAGPSRIPVEEEGGPHDEEAFDLEARGQHWCYQPLKPTTAPPVQDESWPRDPLDRFLLAGLEEAGLLPAPAASPRNWLRRVSYDLTGLPPTPIQMQALLADPSRAAQEQVVDGLLASPAFGERWARHWLDLVRFAETRGHEFDYIIPNAYQYRDYVIRALNADLGYDQFVREHVAGDLLERPRRHPDQGFNESVLGTGFWYLGNEVHSPVDTRHDETERVADQLDTFSKALLGVTLACARCHDHKFDPIRSADYYALSGYLLSSSYRQVRFESLEHNRIVASALHRLRRRQQEPLARALAAALEPVAAQVADSLRAVRRVWEEEPDRCMPPAELQAELLRRSEILYEDFESDTYGAWTVTGTAFGNGPIRAADMPEYQGDVEARGERLVNTHNARSGEDVEEADQHVGTLTSPPFVLEHQHVHFLIGGGNHAGKVELQLIDGDTVLRRATGRNQNRLRAERFDVPELVGRTVQLRLIDEHDGGWGQIGADQIVFSNRSDAGALDRARSEPGALQWQWQVERIARQQQVPAESLLRWLEHLEGAARDVRNPLHPWARRLLPSGRQAQAPVDNLPSPNVGADRLVVDYARLGAEDWLANGFAFGFQPGAAGDLRVYRGPEGPRVEVGERPTARHDRAFDVLEVAEGSDRDPSQVNWTQAGRMLRTRSFLLETGKLWYLVRGSGHAYVAVDSHRLVDGPLHGVVVKSWTGGSGLQWIEHDLSAYVGHRVHVEFSSKEVGAEGSASSYPLAIAAVADAAQDPARLDPVSRHPLLDWIDRARSPEAMAEAYEALFLEAVQRLRDGSLQDEDSLAPLVAWLTRLGDPFRTHLAVAPGRAEAQRLLARVEQVTARIQRVSHLAPTMMDGNGWDEQLLVRGNARTPAGAVPRRFLEVVSRAPGAEPTERDSRGSGRRELAERLLSPENPLTSRALVNRLWHHLFGRGIAPSVDNLGVLGERPTHPELLDYLAQEFMADGWSQKRLLRRLVLSSAYRMSSRVDPRAARLDPKNDLWHHIPVRRLQAEAIRDALLAVSGRLDGSAYGPSVPIHLTPFMDGRGKPTGGPLDGNGRRSVYLSVRRNFLVPFFSAFDFPNPASAIGRRSVSNVPAQALVLLNSPFVTQMAAHWAERVQANGAAKDDAARVVMMYWEAFGRAPREEEREAALAFLLRQRVERELEADDCTVLADLAHVLFNVKEFIYLE